MVSNFHSCDKKLGSVFTVAGENKGVSVVDGYGVSGNVVSDTQNYVLEKLRADPK